MDGQLISLTVRAFCGPLTVQSIIMNVECFEFCDHCDVPSYSTGVHSSCMAC